MRKFILFSFIVSTLLLCACAAGQVEADEPAATLSPSLLRTPLPYSTVTPHAEASSESPYSQETGDIEYDEEWIKQAESCRIKIGNYEYYFDTNSPFLIEDEPDFPLYRNDIEAEYEEYLGINGYYFTIKGDYLYLDSGMFWGDYPHWTTRAVSLLDGSISRAVQDVNIHFDPDSDQIFYTSALDDQIYISDYTFNQERAIAVNLPDWDTILNESGYSKEEAEDCLQLNITITKVEENWIYFNCIVDEVPNWSVYKGSYRITVDGLRIEKTDKGELLSAK